MVFVDANSTVLAYGDDQCGGGSEIRYEVPNTKSCEIYTLREGMHHSFLSIYIYILIYKDIYTYIHIRSINVYLPLHKQRIYTLYYYEPGIIILLL